MNRMWNSVMLPIIEEINAKFIVEIGSDKGINTKNILEYCIKNDAKMATIDPFPKFDVKPFKKDYGNKLKLYEDLSLNILPSLEDYDVIIIDGDHNWYTVYNELKLIENSFKDKNFPLVFLHDVSWPYGRRDLYYNPDNIPIEYKNKHKKEGIRRGSSQLVKNGFNNGVDNAITEKTPKNGVLTAIEDFLNETSNDLSFLHNEAFWGMGIIFQENIISKKIINNHLNSSSLINTLEKERVDNFLKYDEMLSELEKKNKKILDLEKKSKKCFKPIEDNNENFFSRKLRRIFKK